MYSFRQANQMNNSQWIVGYYKFYYKYSVLKIHTNLNCPLESHFLFFIRIYEIDIENNVWSFISMLTFKKYSSWYHINKVVHRDVCAFWIGCELDADMFSTWFSWHWTTKKTIHRYFWNIIYSNIFARNLIDTDHFLKQQLTI